jgi:hypothetical protein
MRKPGCEECHRLREEYSNAVFAYVRLDSRMKMTALRDEVDEDLTKNVETAAARRDSALQQFRDHEATHPLVAAATQVQ